MKDFEGNTALMYACALGSKDLVKLLLDAHNIRHMRLDFDAANNDGATAMLLAHDNFFHDIVQMLSSSMSDQKAGCLICVQESNHEQKRKKEIRRIEQLAEIIKDVPKLNETEDSAPLECAEDDENLKLPHTEMTLTKRYPKACPEETSQPGTSIAKSEEDLRKSSDHLKELLNQAIESREEIKHILDNCGIESSDETRIANEPASNKKKTKRKTKRKRRKYRNEDIPNYGKAVTNENEPRSEYAVGSRIYSVDIYEQEDVTSIRQNIKSNARRKLYDAVNIDSEGNAQYFEIETGKMDCLKLNSEARAKLLGRTVWSVYGAPLPPIPIDDEELQNVIDKISALRKYLRRPKMHEGRLVSLDPELWCIIESMRNELEPTWTKAKTLLLFILAAETILFCQHIFSAYKYYCPASQEWQWRHVLFTKLLGT